jgi:hypothetical protein
MMTRKPRRGMKAKPIWQFNPKEDDPVPFKADILHRGCVRYDPRKLLRKLQKDIAFLTHPVKRREHD